MATPDETADASENLTAEQLTVNLLEAIVMRCGNRPEFRAILDQLKTKVAPPAA